MALATALKLLGRATPDKVAPRDIWVDRDTGVAITSGGLFSESQDLINFSGLPIPESLRAAAFDIQDPEQPLFVGAASSLDDGQQGDLLAAKVQAYIDADHTAPVSFEVGVSSINIEAGVRARRRGVAKTPLCRQWPRRRRSLEP